LFCSDRFTQAGLAHRSNSVSFRTEVDEEDDVIVVPPVARPSLASASRVAEVLRPARRQRSPRAHASLTLVTGHAAVKAVVSPVKRAGATRAIAPPAAA
jgi:hypothetical protein